MPGAVVAVRVPLLHLSNFQIYDWPEVSTRSYALMVLMLPSDSARQWHVHELELVEVVADQVSNIPFYSVAFLAHFISILHVFLLVPIILHRYICHSLLFSYVSRFLNCDKVIFFKIFLCYYF